MARTITRRQLLRMLGAGAVLGGAFGYFHGIEAEWLETTHTRISLPSAAGSRLRILHLGDLHADKRWVSLNYIRRAIAQGLAERPDVICLTGDFITARYDQFSDYTQALQPLARSAPTFACLGNHDGGAWAGEGDGYPTTDAVRELLRASGIQLLHNLGSEFQVRGERWQIVGVGDWWAGECRAEEAFIKTPPRAGARRILLNHNPDAKAALRRHDWDLMLCGHTHGGQIGFPPLARYFAPVEDKRFIAGLYAWENRPLFITRGVGNLMGGRVFCRPEVSVLDIG